MKKTSGEHFIPSNHSCGVSRKEKLHNKKILEVTQKIIELLTREVSGVVGFSMLVHHDNNMVMQTR